MLRVSFKFLFVICINPQQLYPEGGVVLSFLICSGKFNLLLKCNGNALITLAHARVLEPGSAFTCSVQEMKIHS